MAYTEAELIGQLEKDLARPGELYVNCLLYTSDAADEL